jgi:hypothetical protein
MLRFGKMKYSFSEWEISQNSLCVVWERYIEIPLTWKWIAYSAHLMIAPITIWGAYDITKQYACVEAYDITKQYACGRNCTLNFECWSFLGLVMWHVTLSWHWAVAAAAPSQPHHDGVKNWSSILYRVAKIWCSEG